MTVTITPAPIRRSVDVPLPPDRAFALFTAGMGGWWLKTHSIAPTGQARLTVEPRAGGRWYETGTGGETCDWGRVLVWEPPGRVVLVWSLDARWAYDPALHTEVEVGFAALPGGGTRVSLEHRCLDAYGAQAADIAARLGADSGWGGLVAAYATHVRSTADAA